MHQDDPLLGLDALTALATPVLVLLESALSFNVERMARYCTDHGVELAPHVKTTMSPEIARRQLDAGAWGVTVANPAQAAALADVGARRVVVANEVVDAAGIALLSAIPDDVEVLVWVDSVEAVGRLDAAIGRRLDVLVEMGVDGGRAGCRTLEQASEVAAAAADAERLRLVGVSAFEGVVGGRTRSAEAMALVDDLLGRMTETATRLVEAGWCTSDRPVLSAGGSSYFDRVAELLVRPVARRRPLVLLRSGCYVTHDHGTYAEANPVGDEPFRPALELIATVLSRPEAGVAIVNFGRRNAPFDSGLPVPLWLGVPGAPAPTDATVTRLNDQHAWMTFDPAADGPEPSVGDTMGFGISHPCTAFDKWRTVPVVDDARRVIDVVTTRFGTVAGPTS